jgi:hypothetical protein
MFSGADLRLAGVKALDLDEVSKGSASSRQRCVEIGNCSELPFEWRPKHPFVAKTPQFLFLHLFHNLFEADSRLRFPHLPSVQSISCN